MGGACGCFGRIALKLLLSYGYKFTLQITPEPADEKPDKESYSDGSWYKNSYIEQHIEIRPHIV